MSEIPYFFETPIPINFRRDGWFSTDNTLKFVTWAFSRCSSIEREICHDSQRIVLKPFQFIFGRRICSTETNMSEMEVRIQQKRMEDAGFLRKTTNKTPNRFTIYEWVTEAFSQRALKQPTKQPTEYLPKTTLKQDFKESTTNKTTKSQPTSNHNLERKNVEASFVKDVIGCGNVHKSSVEENSPFSQAASSSLSLDSLKNSQLEFICGFKFLNGENIQGKVQARWIRIYPWEEIIASLKYLEKMQKKKSIPKEEAYVEDCLKNRYWETNKMREEATKREKLHEAERKNRAKEYE